MANAPEDKDFATRKRPEGAGPDTSRADDTARKVPPDNPAAGTRDVKTDPDWSDQSQGPNHPLDESGRKRR